MPSGTSSFLPFSVIITASNFFFTLCDFHEKMEVGYYIAEPNAKVVEHIEKIANVFNRPKIIYSLCKLNYPHFLKSCSISSLWVMPSSSGVSNTNGICFTIGDVTIPFKDSSSIRPFWKMFA